MGVGQAGEVFYVLSRGIPASLHWRQADSGKWPGALAAGGWASATASGSIAATIRVDFVRMGNGVGAIQPARLA